MARGLFNQSAALIYPAERESYLNNTVKSDTSAMPGYSPAQEGYLSILGKTLSGVGAAFAGDTQWGQRQQKMDQEMMQADLEFKAALQKQYYDNNRKSEMKQVILADPTTGTLKTLGSVPVKASIIQDQLSLATAKNNLPTADMRNNAYTLDSTKALWEDLKSQAMDLKGGYSGMFESGKAALNRGSGDSAKYLAYQDSMPSAAVALYRGLTGDTRLSDSDAKGRALPLLWEPSQSIDVREKKSNFIDRMIIAREKLSNSGKYKDGVIPFEAIKNAAKIIDSPKSNQSGSVDPRYQQAIKAGYTKEEIDAYLKGKK